LLNFKSLPHLTNQNGRRVLEYWQRVRTLGLGAIKAFLFGASQPFSKVQGALIQCVKG
jgi:preprotein translocase subunit SecY